MEQHPVPQNVTTFQFRLIGDMTIKQFGYLAGGAILAYTCYKLPLPLFLNWGLAISATLLGFGLAFVPIEERPMDVWILSFFKSIYSPTIYTWQKQAPAIPVQAQGVASVPMPQKAAARAVEAPHPQARRDNILQNIFQVQEPAQRDSSAPVPLAGNNGFWKTFDWFFSQFIPQLTRRADSATPVGQPLRPNVPPASHAGNTAHGAASLPSIFAAKMDFRAPPAVRSRGDLIAETVKKEADVQGKLVAVQRELGEKTLAQSQVIELQKQLADLVRDRDTMEAEIARLRLQADATPRPKPTGTYVATPAAKQGPSVRVITPDRAVKVGLPRLTTFPNVVTGIVKDGDQNLLPGVLVTIKDKDGVPVRALKTNRLGQFAASTPLSNATYVVEIEDPRLRYTFDRAQITLNGSIVPALEIFAKSQKEITRAKLEKELFGNKPT